MFYYCECLDPWGNSVVDVLLGMDNWYENLKSYHEFKTDAKNFPCAPDVG